MAPAKSTRGNHGAVASSSDMHRSNTNSSTASTASTVVHNYHGHSNGHGPGHGHAHPHSQGPAALSHSHSHAHTHGGATCSCGNPIHPNTPGTKTISPSPFHDLGLASPNKPMTTAATIKRQRELREFALIDKLLSRIFWLRFCEDAARLYSARLSIIAKERLPYLMQNIIAAGGGPGWAAANAKCEELREYFRLQIQVDLRELEDRVWHISSEWTYTAIRRMAITNGVDVSPAGLRATDLLTLVPLLEAMCDNLENAPQSTYEIHPVKSIAGTFVSLYPDFRIPPLPSKTAKANGQMPRADTLASSSKYAAFLKYAPDILLACSHHPSGKCSLELAGTTPWGPSLYKITTAPVPPSKSKDNSSPLSPASMLFDALFPSLPRSAVPAKGMPKSSGLFSGAKEKTFKSDMAHAQIELRSILALGLSRLFIVLFQTALEFDIRSFGENVNLAFGPGYVDVDGLEDGDEEYYGGCECCMDEFYDNAEQANGGRHDNPLQELWSSLTQAEAPARRRSAKRARTRQQAADHASASRSRRRRYKSIFAPRPGAGLKAWDAVLHYEAIIREEEEEKEKKEEEKRLEKEKYGLKGSLSASNSPTAALHPPTPSRGKPTAENVSLDIDKLATGIYASNFPSKRRAGKARESSECDGRGGGLIGWNSCHEEDVWERDLDSTDDFGIEDYLGLNNNKTKDLDEPPTDDCRCKRVAMRYLNAEEHKEDGNIAFRRGEYEEAIACYTAAHKSEPRLPIYLLNRAMAELKVNRWYEAEMDCTSVLRKHRTNPKALWRRAKARRAIASSSGNVEKLIGAERDLLDFLAILPDSSEGYSELASVRADLCPCFECSDVSQLFASTGSASPKDYKDTLQYLSSGSSRIPPRSCFNKMYRSSPYLTSASNLERVLIDTPLAKSRDVLASIPKGWFPPRTTSSTPKSGKGSPAAAEESRFFNLSSTAPKQSLIKNTADPAYFDKEFWAEVVQDFNFVPESVCLPEDRLALHFQSDHDLESCTLPCWDLYKIVPA